ncbi:predicted protein [Lichtheimia corymbifera JMRC:FSU:9682]|uniref:Uncharacterized protein n=1 Tax=Lichtheimia corymbifera JMRC:FSU:9682 TaxID=1263082 RepID=A0A068RJN6_9FUNG|nr:predicted protein [Lichtheimia corymbifera JMRC:FSU:9682]
MAIAISQLRGAFALNHFKPRKATSASSKRKKSLTVTISKEPPVIHCIEQDKLECTFECIFDPLVRHDDESDHPDLCKSKPSCKPWQKPPYKNDHPSNIANVLRRLWVHPKIKDSNQPPKSSK